MHKALILPCAGRGKRLGLPYPKELHCIEEGNSLIDYSLKAAAIAGIKTAYLVVSADKLRPLAQGLGGDRHGVRLIYVHLHPEDAVNEVSSLLRGVRKASAGDGFDNFLVAFPDCYYGNPNIFIPTGLVDSPMIGLYTGRSKGELAYFSMDNKTVSRFKRTSGSLSGDDRLINTLRNDENRYLVHPFKDNFVNVDTWSDVMRVREILEVK